MDVEVSNVERDNIAFHVFLDGYSDRMSKNDKMFLFCGYCDSCLTNICGEEGDCFEALVERD